MADHRQDLADRLCHLTLSLRAQLDQAEARVPTINEIVTQLNEMRVLDEAVVLGLVIYQAHFSLHIGPQDSGQVVQAVLMIPKGFGVISWESHEFLALRKNSLPDDAELILRFVPFEECPTAIKALLLPQVHPLLVMLLKHLRTPNPPQN